MTNELTRPLTDAEEGLWREKLAALLVRQIALYTANESSSVPAAAARELLEQGVGCIELCGAFGPDGARRIIEATENRIPVGYVTHLPEQEAVYRAAFPND